MTPLQQWAQTGEAVRFPEPGLDLDDLFLFEAQRKVQKDRTVSLNGVVYEGRCRPGWRESDPALRSPPPRPNTPYRVCHKGKPIELARPVQTYANCFVKRNRPSWTLHIRFPAPEPPPSGLKLRTIFDPMNPRRNTDVPASHFTFTAFPFDLTPEPEELFASSTLAEAEARLKHLLELRAIGLVTGEAGIRKDHGVPQGRLRTAPGPLSSLLCPPVHRQRHGYV